VVANQVGDPMGEGPGLAAARPSHHQQWPTVVAHRLALGIIKARQKSGGPR
jgi:hypothetical protein